MSYIFIGHSRFVVSCLWWLLLMLKNRVWYNKVKTKNRVCKTKKQNMHINSRFFQCFCWRRYRKQGLNGYWFLEFRCCTETLLREILFYTHDFLSLIQIKPNIIPSPTHQILIKFAVTLFTTIFFLLILPFLYTNCITFMFIHFMFVITFLIQFLLTNYTYLYFLIFPTAFYKIISNLYYL